MKERKKKVSSPISILSQHRLELSFEKEGMRILVEGVRKITVCRIERVELLASREKMIFVGDGLTTVAYAGGALEITGKIDGISFARLDGAEE